MRARSSRRVFRNRKSGMTLIEMTVSFTIFAVAATGVVASLIQARKLSESNLAQGYAHSTAQAVIEEVIRVPPSMLADETLTSIDIKLARLTDTNCTALEDFTLSWATDDTTYVEIGTTEAGILTDAAYVADANEIRPERFMRMRLNLQREIETDQNRVRIVLRYQWEIPDRRGANGDPIFLDGEIRTIRSTALRF
jgi:prepilin-type N-terminal cleavage/methylation domain-containing protein